MPIEGFSERWKDFPDYIIGITKEIWEDRGIATLNHYYAKDIPMRFPSGISRGNQGVIDSTHATLAEFPDRQLLGEDVIWSNDPDYGLLSSHRILSSGTHLGDGYFGKATGKRFVARVIADCAAKNDTIYDEWLCRDTTAIVLQLGGKPKRFARNLIEREGGPDNCIKPFTPEMNVDGGYNSTGNDSEWGQQMGEILARIMDKDTAVIREKYDRACRVEYPGAVSGHSWDAAEHHWMGLRASFPSAKFHIEHQIGNVDPMLGPRASVRWWLIGKHDGFGAFGKPTGADVAVMGFTHGDFGPWGLREEYTLYDSVSIWEQIIMQTG